MSKRLILSFLLSIFIIDTIQANPVKSEVFTALKWGTGFTCGAFGIASIVHNFPNFYEKYKAPSLSTTEKIKDEIKKKWYSMPHEIRQIILSTSQIGCLMLLSYYIQTRFLTSSSFFTFHKAGSVKERFSNVAGNQHAQEELSDIIQYLQSPRNFSKLGAKVPKGVLLTGPPGTGKTLLARALAGHANCSFISCTGSSFVEMYVGLGAAKMRTLFNQARTKSPCIIFIDEIDTVAQKRKSSSGGGDTEYNQTINQLLSEMDGFVKNNKPIIIIGATNNIDDLDPAILRPGRFDRIVHVQLPDTTGREAILKVHVKKITHDPNLDILKIAQATPGFSGADLENLVNEAAIIATKKKNQFVTIIEFEEARDKIMIGSKNSTLKMTSLEKKHTACHESGHALMCLLMPEQNNVLNKITILSQGQTLGTTHFLPEHEIHSYNQQQLLAQINIALAGRAAEELVLNNINSGASNDFEQASKIARAMICKFGMTNILGKQVLLSNQPYSQDTLKKIDEGVTQILETQYKFVLETLKSNRKKLDLLTKTLLEKETLYADDIYTLLNIPPRKTFKLT